MSETPEIIGSREVAEILGVSQRTAQRILLHEAETGEIPVILTSSRGERMVARDAVERYAHKDS